MVDMMEKFTVFPSLPPEIRLMIWRFSLPGPRNINMSYRIKNSRFAGWGIRRSKNNHPPRPPMTLQICHESRKEAQRHYMLSFGTDAFPATVYFNHQIDTLCFSGNDDDGGVDNDDEESLIVRTSIPGPSDYLLNLWVGKTLKDHETKVIQSSANNVRLLTLDADDSIYSRPLFCWEEIRRFEGLEELRLIAWGPEENENELMFYFKTSMRAVVDAHPEWMVPNIQVLSALGKNLGRLQPVKMG